METLYDRPDVQQAIQSCDAAALEAFARLLNPLESVVWNGRIIGRPPRRWESLGRSMGITREQVRRLEAAIIIKFEAWQRQASQ